MREDTELHPSRLLARAGPPNPVQSFPGVQIDDDRLVEILPFDRPLLQLYEGTIHGEGPALQPNRERLVWSDVPNRRLLAWYPDGRVEVEIDGKREEARAAFLRCCPNGQFAPIGHINPNR